MGTVSNSPVPFPVASYMERMQHISGTIAAQLTESKIEDPQRACVFVEDMLFVKFGFKPTPFGPSNLPAQ